ncbi:YceD family protein [Nesterenkonia halotolerans]|uniref:YceD family protein n=1 Tax=Nesterenkonia halotolerans TaxID=225325 RepID=UPI003EE6CE39
MTALTVDVQELRGRPGTQDELSRTVPAPKDLATVLIGIPQGSDLQLDLRLESVHEGVLMTGTASAEVSGQCGRCLDEIRYPLTVDVMQLFSWPQKAQAAADAEDEDTRLIPHDLTIDLEPVLRDLMVSALPFQPVCREDCPGLCSECGFRMEDDPEHFHEQLDPRWAALKDVAAGMPDPDSSSESST